VKRSLLVPAFLLLFVFALGFAILFARSHPQSQLASLYSWAARHYAEQPREARDEARRGVARAGLQSVAA
jgi:hypothetical protein